MLNKITFLVSLSLPLLASGCFSVAPNGRNEAAGTSVGSWQMPWQLDPIARTRGERIARAYVPGAGYVRGTRQALASIGRQLRPAAGYNHTVETCRRTVAGEADKRGARQVEAVSAGPDHLDARGHWVGPVLIRVNYLRPSGYEVRMAVLTCITDQNDKIVDAYAYGSRRAG